MEKDLLKVFENFGIQSLIHVGGHKGQEIEFYKSLDLDKVIFFEPVEKFATEIKMKTQSLKNFEVYQLALGNEDIEKEIYIADEGVNDNSGSTSILKPRKSKITFSQKEKIQVRKFINLGIGNIESAVIDTQGYELEVLKGFGEKISEFKILLVEFSTIEGYESRPLYKELNQYLNTMNFFMIRQQKKVLTLLKSDISGSYGDALYLNGELINKPYKFYLFVKYFLINNFIGEFVNFFSKKDNYKKIIKKLLKKTNLYSFFLKLRKLLGKKL